MITFLRKIRRTMIGSGSISRYLLYAIGEIVLVVIGILIALQINNWNEYRKDRIIEREVLNDIADNLFRNSEQMEQSLSILTQTDNSYEVILYAFRNDLPYSDTLDHHFFHSQFNKSIFVNISMGGYESLKSAGFDILSSKKLKDEILKLYESEYKKFEKIVNWLLSILTNNDPFVVNNFIQGSGSSQGFTPINYDRLKEDTGYYSFLNRVASQRGLLKDYQAQALQETQIVLQLIKEELGE